MIWIIYGLAGFGALCLYFIIGLFLAMKCLPVQIGNEAPVFILGWPVFWPQMLWFVYGRRGS